MNIRIKRYLVEEDGVFGAMYDDEYRLIARTLEHSYPIDGEFLTKVAAGQYKCVRHQPHHLPYETFILCDVPSFQGEPVTGILIHIGNFNKDSDGCILIGELIVNEKEVGLMLLHSKEAFERFMKLQDGVSEFLLTIQDPDPL